MPAYPSRILSLVTLFTILLLTGCSEEAVGGVVAGSIVIYLVGGLLLFLLVIFALVDLYKKSYPTSKKIIWLLIILIVPYIGAILYFLIGRNDSAVI